MQNLYHDRIYGRRNLKGALEMIFSVTRGGFNCRHNILYVKGTDGK